MRHRAPVQPAVLLVSLLALAVALFGPAERAHAADKIVTYSYTQTIPVPPASTYAGSGGGDGWGLAMTPKAVYNVFHHSSQLRVACHLQSDASACWDPKLVQDGNGNDFRVAGQPSMWMDQNNGHLHVYATRSADSSAGVVCIDTTRAADVADLFCGFKVLAPAGEAPSTSGVSNGVLVANRFFSFNYNGGTGPSGAENKLLCFDTTTGDACLGQPYAVGFGADAASVPDPSWRVPSLAAIAGKIIVPIDAGGQKLACFDTVSDAPCGGSWPAPIGFDFTNNNGAPFPTLSTDGTPTGVCLPAGSIPCFDLTGASAVTPAGLSGVITPGTPWSGPALTIGPRIYLANGNYDRVECFNFSTSAACDGFPRSTPGAGYIYSVNADPQRPDCVWINADYGSGQIQNFDAYSGGACGQGPIRVLASSIVVPSQRCQPTGYTSMTIDQPPRTAYTSGSVAFLDGDGKPIPGIADRPIDADGTVSMTGLDLSTATGLPQFRISLEGASGTPTSVQVTLVWRGVLDESCVKPDTNTREYEALGDSFSSGFGNAPFDFGTHKDNGPNDCQRSTTAYSHVVTDEFDLNLGFDACQGAVTKDFYAPRNSTWGESAQLDHLTPNTGLVTFSIGGNDAHFATVVRDCIDGYELLPFNTCNGDDRVRNPVEEAIARLAGTRSTPADTTPYDQIFKDVRARSPFAKRVVVGYPEFFPEDGGDRTFLPGGRCEGIKKADQRWMVEEIRKLDGIIRTAASRNGFRYADPMPRFDGHQLCSGGDEWIGGVLDDNRFHPTVDGQKALGESVIDALNDPSQAGGVFKVEPNQTVDGTTTVPVGQSRLTIIAQWPGSDVPLTLISPTGKTYTRDHPGDGVAHDVGPTWEQYEISDPEPGVWKYQLFGKDVKLEGEPVTVVPTVEAPANVPPTAKISYTQNADGSLTFSSAQSSDSDGQLIAREWYVSTGKDTEEHTVGDTVTIPAGAAGKSVTLVVTDNRKDTGFDNVVIPEAAPAAGAPPVQTATGASVKPVADRTPPKVTKLTLQKRVRKGKRLVWVPTKRLTGAVRLRMTVSEPGTVTLKVSSARTPKKVRTVRVKVTKAGVVTIDLRKALRGLRAGKVRLALSVRDTTGNVTARTLSARR